MALDFHKDEYNKPKVAPAETSTVGTSSVAPAAEQPAAKPVPIVEEKPKDDTKGLAVSKGNDAPAAKEPTIDDEYQALKEKLLKGEIKQEDLTPEQKNLIKSYEKQTEEYEKRAENLNSNISPEKAKRFEEYRKIMQSGKNNHYEKASFIMDQYLLQNDKEYKKLPEYHLKEGDKGYDYKKDLRRQYRDGIIHDMQEKLYPGVSSKNLDLKRRQAGFNQIAKIFMLCDKDDRTIESVLSLPREEILKKIAENDYNRIDNVFKQAKIDDKNLSAYQKLNNIADVILSDNPKYKNLKTDAEKENFRQKYIAGMLGKVFNMDVSIDFIKDSKNETLLKAALGLQQVLEKDKIGLDEFTMLSTKKQAKYIYDALKKMPDDNDNIKFSKAKFKALSDIDKENATERDVLDYLSKKENKSEAEDTLLESYKLLGDSKILNEKAEISSILTLSALTNVNPEKIAASRLNHHLKGKDSVDELFKDRKFQDFIRELNIAGDASVDDFTIKYIAKKFGISEKDVIERLEQKGHNHRRAMANAFALKDSNKIVMAKWHASAMKDKENIRESCSIIKLGSQKLDAKTINAIETNPLSEQIAKNNPAFTKSAWQGYNTNQNLSNQDRTDIQNNIQKAGFSDGYKQFAVKSMVSTASAEQQKYYVNHYKDTTDSNIVKGFAAAEPDIDASVKQEYSQVLNHMIENNGLQNDNDIKMARETGQTSFERNNAESVKNAETSSSETGNKTKNSVSQTSSSSQSAGARQSSSTAPAVTVQGVKVTTGTLYITSDSKRYTKEIKATLAMLDSENKKADAKKKVADNIAKIQQESLKHEKEAEKKKIEEQKQKAEQIKVENEKKTQAQHDADLSSALETEIEAIKEEIPTSPEAAEVQKQFSSMYSELRSYAKAGQMDQVFSMLGKIPKAQEKFLEKLATKHISTITHFIKGADKSILKFMCEKNPGIISTLDTNTLMILCNSGFPKTMIIKYGDKNQVAGMLSDLQLASTKDTLNEFYEVMGLAKDEKDTADASEVIKKNDRLADGGDDHMAKLLENMRRASNDIASAGVHQGTVVPNWKEPEKKVPRELWG